MKTFEINGEMWQEIPQSPRRFSKSMSRMMMATMMLSGGITYRNEFRSVHVPNVDIIKEYGLIQQKICKRSRRERDWIVATFERRYMKVLPPEELPELKGQSSEDSEKD